MFALDQIIQWLLAYKYFILFPTMVVEGPMVTVIASFLASLNKLNVFVVYFLAVLANLTSDTIIYAIGRWGRAVWKYFGFRPEKISSVENHFKQHKIKTLLVGKVALGIGNLALAAAGVAKMNFLEYLGINFLIELPKALIFVLVGFYFGRAYAMIDRYLSDATIFIVVSSVFLYVVYRLARLGLAKYYKEKL